MTVLEKHMQGKNHSDCEGQNKGTSPPTRFECTEHVRIVFGQS